MKNKEAESPNTSIQIEEKMYGAELHGKQSYHGLRKLWLSIRALKELLHNKAVRTICDYKVKKILSAINSSE